MTRYSRTEHGIRAGVRRLFRLPLRTGDIARADADMELDSFLEERVASLVRRGMAPAEAREEALRRLGGPLNDVRATLRHSAERREGRLRFHDMIDDLVDDVRFTGRQFAKAPSFAAVSILTLALSIGANTAIFSVVHRLLLAPLPYPNGDRIVMPMQEGDLPFPWSIGPDVADAWQARTKTVASIAGASEDMFTVRPDGSVDTIPSAAVTANFLPMLGVRPILGRGFAVEEERPNGQAAVAMISADLWRRTYGGRADVLGRTVQLEGMSLVIIGVTPPGLAIPMSHTAAPDIWVPAPLKWAGAMGSGSLEPGPAIFATLRSGASFEAAARELESIAASMPKKAWGPMRARTRLMRARDFLDPRERRAVEVLFAAVGALLLIACANVANLLLARAWTRQREFAVRVALGAGRARIARQVLTESVSLALAGGTLGVGVAWLTLRSIISMRPPALDQLADVRLESAVLLWSLGVSVATGMLFGCAPALLAGAQQAGDVLRSETRGASRGITARRVRSTLIVLEIAASLVLLVGSGLLVRSFAALQRMPLGFEPRGLVYTAVLTGNTRDIGRKVALRDAIVERLREAPGVTGVAIGTMPGKAYFGLGGLEAETDDEGHTTRVPILGTVLITPDYFRVARIALLDGRLPNTAAGTAAAFDLSPEVLVNHEFARRVWPDGHVLGARVRNAPDANSDGRVEPWSTVVGVVDDTRMPEVRGDIASVQVYSLVPARLGDVPIIVRTATSGDDAAPIVKHAIASVNPAFFVRPVLSGDTYLRNGLAPTRFAMALITAFALLALVLAAVGLYGVVSYSVSQRTREIGVRVALGAEPKTVIRLVVGVSVRLVSVGVLLGAVVALAVTRVIVNMLYEVRPADPLTFGAVALLVAAIAIMASYVPVRRALRVDPSEALRMD